MNRTYSLDFDLTAQSMANLDDTICSVHPLPDWPPAWHLSKLHHFNIRAYNIMSCSFANVFGIDIPR